MGATNVIVSMAGNGALLVASNGEVTKWAYQAARW